ncbi:MAG: sulfur carrier protein ThiS [Candidatus Velthaea sp.]
MTITLNGERRDVAAGTTLGALIAAVGVRRDGIAVARNEDVVPRATIDATPLADGDAVEIIAAVAGG